MQHAMRLLNSYPNSYWMKGRSIAVFPSSQYLSHDTFASLLRHTTNCKEKQACEQTLLVFNMQLVSLLPPSNYEITPHFAQHEN